jgi:hypothetical protein
MSSLRADMSGSGSDMFDQTSFLHCEKVDQEPRQPV